MPSALKFIIRMSEKTPPKSSETDIVFEKRLKKMGDARSQPLSRAILFRTQPAHSAA